MQACYAPLLVCDHDQDAVQVQQKLQEQLERAQEAEGNAEVLKKENGSLKNVAGKLKAAQKEIERLREAWTDKDVKLAEANNAANSQRHVSGLASYERALY